MRRWGAASEGPQVHRPTGGYRLSDNAQRCRTARLLILMLDETTEAGGAQQMSLVATNVGDRLKKRCGVSVAYGANDSIAGIQFHVGAVSGLDPTMKRRMDNLAQE
jgi:hypothetical protein